MSGCGEIEQLPIINVHTNLRSVLHDSIVPKNLNWSECYIKILTLSSFSAEIYKVLTAVDKEGTYYRPIDPHNNGEFEIFFYFNCQCCDFYPERTVLIRNRN